MDVVPAITIKDPAPMVRAIEEYDELSVIKLTGDFDFDTIPPVENVIKTYRKQLDQDIVLDFYEVTRIDTSTLAVLIYLINILKQKHQRVSLIRCNDLVKDYVKMSKLESIIRIYDALDEVFGRAKGQA